MPLENILQALETEAERQVIEVEQTAQAEIERIRAQAQAAAVIVRQRHIAAIRTPLQAEQARILNQAKLEALQIVLGTREALITAALKLTVRRLAELATTEAYSELLQQLTQEAVDTLDLDGRLCLHVQSCDVERMSCIVQEMGLSASVEGGLENEDPSQNCLGGLIVTTSDGRISLVNTLEARLQRVARLFRAQIARMIFSAEQED